MKLKGLGGVFLLRIMLYWLGCLAEDGKCEAQAGSAQSILVVTNLLLWKI